MSFPIVENPRGDYCYCNGEKLSFASDRGAALFSPVDQTIYYESIRFKNGVLIFFEDHMLRLYRSVMAKEAFDFDSEFLYEESMKLIREIAGSDSDGNLRIVLTKEQSVVHLSDAKYPEPSMFEQGIITSTLRWERIEPQVKVFRGDYKKAVAQCMGRPNSFGIPYEVLLCDSQGKITEGSRSNFFVLVEDTVNSPPESQILIGITRKYVIAALHNAGLSYREHSYSIADLKKMMQESEGKADPAVFVTSSPFDVLPIRSIDDISFRSSDHPMIKKLSNEYISIVNKYIATRNMPDESGQ